MSFELDDGRQVLGFLPFQSVEDQRDFLEAGIQSGDYLAEVAGAQNGGVTDSAWRIAYIFDGTEWKLVWFVNEHGVFRTEYYDDLAPHIEAYLSGPGTEAPYIQGEGPAT
jgi:hypothetical protein